ncbi:MAG: sigma 54-interacting transcriptional regulator [Sedimentibacter saalensis]|uniref:Transcriptional regulator with PAS, ATPase and Fis domain n=1 Tax=Sedimentibacter saalensis TaxID=130788 RepID=A0A562JFA5_9FIRM|nr:sigma 54-interacting transcriptional regulator [Sedimentibacter saalensis]MEA5095341.1 sigma 54-interacting transcriptional regulator [Sedimentibacter saalensis]TWH81504.1 transcriptional regulator with PAS, ATPase and Fis domain [Sedimentibacter saalensis]
MTNLLSKTYADYVQNGFKRCEALNTDKDSNVCFFNISAFDLDFLLAESKEVLHQSEQIMENMCEYMDSFISIFFVNKDGYILKEKKCKGYNLDFGMNLPLGGRFTEKFNGNTSISTSIAENRPICLMGDEHYCSCYHDYATLSAPVYNGGEIVGVLSAICLKEHASSYALGMIASSARAISIGYEAEKINKAIVEKNKYESAIVETLTDGVLTVDKDGFVTYLNQVGAEILCVNREKSIGKHISNVVDFKPVVLDVLKTGKGYIDKEFLLTNAAGIKIHFIKTAVPIKDENGNVVTVVDTFRKIKRVNKFLNEMTGAYANFNFEDIIGSSSKLQDCINTAKAAAGSLSNVLITGESGTGKELIAHSIHNYSDRRKQPFVSINCGAIPRELLESELFGYEPGSFTGASTKGRIGKFELADGGTIFLDEIGEMPMDMQVKLLRVIQDRKLTRVGGNSVFDLDVRIIAATNKNLLDLCKKGIFREDLYYRINVLHVNLPSLRERKEDIHELIRHFIKKVSNYLNKTVNDISPGAMKKILSYSWPGNIRELENAIERAVNLCSGSVITENEIFNNEWSINNAATRQAEEFSAASFETLSERDIEPLEVMERRAIERALSISGGNITITANMLQVTRNTIYNKMKKYNLAE